MFGFKPPPRWLVFLRAVAIMMLILVFYLFFLLYRILIRLSAPGL